MSNKRKIINRVKLHTIEREFHDNWASTIKEREINFKGAFMASTAVENLYALKNLGDLKGKTILDLGCGMGDASLYFASRGTHIESIDISPGMIEVLNATKKKYKFGKNINAKTMLAEDLKYRSEYFDYVFGNGILHHVLVDDALKEVFRVLKKGGRAVFIEPLSHNPVINVYRKIAEKVRTPTEKPLNFDTLGKLTKAKFAKTWHKEFHFFTLFIFLWYFVVECTDPNKKRYWKLIIDDEKRIRPYFKILRSLDNFLFRLIPCLSRYCWNTVIVFIK